MGKGTPPQKRQDKTTTSTTPTVRQNQAPKLRDDTGEEISMIGSLEKAVKQRIAKAHQTWKHVHFKLLRNKKSPQS